LPYATSPKIAMMSTVRITVDDVDGSEHEQQDARERDQPWPRSSSTAARLKATDRRGCDAG
jgi:hypothetical protein